MSSRFHRLTSFALMLALALPLSANAESRSRGRTDLERTAEALGLRVTRTPRRTTTTTTSVMRMFSAEAVVAAMNEERVARGLRPLRLNDKLSLAAEDRIDDMFAKRYFDHVSPDGINPFVWVRKRGYAYRAIGENLAVGYPTAGRVVDGWMHSPGHRENILHRAFDEVGIAIANGSPVSRMSAPTIVALYGSR